MKAKTAPSGAVFLCLCGLRIAIVVVALASIPAARASITIETSALANLAYQLDCVAAVPVPCGAREAFRELWSGTFGIDTTADPRILRWRELRAKHEDASGARRLDLHERVRRAGLLARSVDDYERRVRELVSSVDARDLAVVLAQLAPAFDAWWRGEPFRALEATARTLGAALASPELREEIAFIERFYGVGSVPFVVYAILRPFHASGNTSAQLVGDVAVAEVIADEPIEERVPVLVHEYAHLLFSRVPADRIAALRSGVLEHGRGRGAAAWQLLDETLATALGNGRVARRLMIHDRWHAHLNADESLYADAAIDVAAKATLPLVDDAFDLKRTIADPEFARRYATRVVARLAASTARAAAPPATATSRTRRR